ncbi:MAG: hypothetical protein IM583_18665 [Pseudanabaena sp. M114S2SP2A07QC]|nr:hypothetical protein [Pseudanabaena sp. M090S1SP2A07QC]MCA6507382.1 hypothetical protein [Pseudanabaena sp. M172S2SP2A07QC]MCA6520355.1 hypothetical protein [Pseudanabaena sp. M051S1SP2A07QC]MCA6525353.1 hypothetical protein [Pseudanabaena sp. M179S2SP2A07QC]MCA6528745.1 hypothetical protein [Pseudanabaena sp. M125S2SP2A07QC]MCA6539165.1 hypothetical protein [Pseudanabaena sp. M037S2SP2A07QC]MCA6544016.1 hypothetical protein [Pseudanabaena sp. M074S1SP2A07QC]MCA6558581.1 hypothetical prot
MTFIERRSRYWIVAKAGLKTTELMVKDAMPNNYGKWQVCASNPPK